MMMVTIAMMTKKATTMMMMIIINNTTIDNYYDYDNQQTKRPNPFYDDRDFINLPLALASLLKSRRAFPLFVCFYFLCSSVYVFPSSSSSSSYPYF